MSISKKEFVEIISPLFVINDIEPDQKTLSAWYFVLSEFSREQIDTACKKVCSQVTFGKPKPAHIIEAIQGKPEENKQAERNQAAIALSTFDRVVRHCSPYESLTLEKVGGDARVLAAINDIGGWISVCSTASEERLKWVKKEFEASYLARLDTPENKLPLKSFGIEDKSLSKQNGVQTMNNLLSNIQQRKGDDPCLSQ